MKATVTPLPSGAAIRTPLGHAIRTGEAWYKRLENLHTKGRLPAQTVVVDASKAQHQKGFIQTLRNDGTDVILDTKVAELSEIGKYGALMRHIPWAPVDAPRPLMARDFEPGARIDVFGGIARMAVELGVTAVIAPAHFLLHGAMSTWLPIDRQSVLSLRGALDREGGQHIAIDHSLILPHTRIRDKAETDQIMRALRNLPVDNLILRLSGFGADARPAAIKRTLIAIEQFHSLGYPILLDYVGGLVGLSALAFGIVSGIAHGIGERERFSAQGWSKQPKERDSDAPFARTIYIPLPDFDKSFRKRDLEAIANSRGGRRLVACDDRNCCPNGLESMLANPRAHIARQRILAVEGLYEIPDALRIEHFLKFDMDSARRKASDLSRLKLDKSGLEGTIKANRKRIEDMIGMYESLADRERPFPPALIRRQGINLPAQGTLI